MISNCVAGAKTFFGTKKSVIQSLEGEFTKYIHVRLVDFRGLVTCWYTDEESVSE